MSTPEILWNDLCASISDESIANSMDVCAADDGLTVAGWTVPPVVMAIAKWAIAQATKYGCEYRDQIMTAVRTFVVDKIPNPMLQGMILAAAETMVLQQCG